MIADILGDRPEMKYQWRQYSIYSCPRNYSVVRYLGVSGHRFYRSVLGAIAQCVFTPGLVSCHFDYPHVVSFIFKHPGQIRADRGCCHFPPFQVQEARSRDHLLCLGAQEETSYALCRVECGAAVP